MKKARFQIFTIFILLSIFKIQCKKIPDYINICKRDPDTIDECVKKSIDSLREHLKVGIPELRVPALEPLIIPQVAFDLGGVVNFRGVGKQIKVKGMSDYTFKSITVDLDELVFTGSVYFPILDFDGNYDIDARLFVVPYHGSGSIVANATHCSAELILYGKLEEKKGKQYLRFRDVTMDINIEDFTSRYENFNDGGLELGGLITRAINDNKVDFFRAIKPFLGVSASAYIKKVSNRIANSFPFDSLVPLP